MQLTVIMRTNSAIAGAGLTGACAATLRDVATTYEPRNDHGAVAGSCFPSAASANIEPSWNLQGLDGRDGAGGPHASATRSEVNRASGVTIVGASNKPRARSGSKDARPEAWDIRIEARVSTSSVVAPEGVAGRGLSEVTPMTPSVMDAPLGSMAVSIADLKTDTSGANSSFAASVTDSRPMTQTDMSVAGEVAERGALTASNAPKGTLVLR